ncbi:hypothetical protein MHYP_G00072830 [Metynnis hypsauchen]
MATVGIDGPRHWPRGYIAVREGRTTPRCVLGLGLGAELLADPGSEAARPASRCPDVRNRLLGLQRLCDAALSGPGASSALSKPGRGQRTPVTATRTFAFEKDGLAGLEAPLIPPTSPQCGQPG